MISGAHSSGIVAVATPAIAQEEAASAGGTAYFSFMLGCWAAPATSEQRDDVSSSVWPRLVVALLLPPHLQIFRRDLGCFPLSSWPSASARDSSTHLPDDFFGKTCGAAFLAPQSLCR